MNKSQKIWLWVSLGMFFTTEILFSFIPSFFAFMLGYNDFPSIISKIITNIFLESNPIITFVFIGIEFLGALGFLVWNIKFNDNKYKIVLTITTALVLVLLLFIFYIGYAITNIGF